MLKLLTGKEGIPTITGKNLLLPQAFKLITLKTCLETVYRVYDVIMKTIQKTNYQQCVNQLHRKPQSGRS